MSENDANDANEPGDAIDANEPVGAHDTNPAGDADDANDKSAAENADDSTDAGDAGKNVPPAGEAEERQQRSPWSLVIPAITFVLGLGLGALLAAAGGDDEAPAVAQPTATPSPEPSPDTADETTPGDGATIVIPQACITTAEHAEDVSALMQRAVEAVRDLDAAQLRDIVDELQALQPQIEESAQACRVFASPTP